MSWSAAGRTPAARRDQPRPPRRAVPRRAGRVRRPRARQPAPAARGGGHPGGPGGGQGRLPRPAAARRRHEPLPVRRGRRTRRLPVHACGPSPLRPAAVGPAGRPVRPAGRGRPARRRRAAGRRGGEPTPPSPPGWRRCGPGRRAGWRPTPSSPPGGSTTWRPSTAPPPGWSSARCGRPAHRARARRVRRVARTIADLAGDDGVLAVEHVSAALACGPTRPSSTGGRRDRALAGPAPGSPTAWTGRQACRHGAAAPAHAPPWPGCAAWAAPTRPGATSPRGARGAGERWRDAAVLGALGTGADDLIQAWQAAAAGIDVGASWRRVRLRASGWPARLARPTRPLAGDLEPPAVLFHQGDLGTIAGPRWRSSAPGAARPPGRAWPSSWAATWRRPAWRSSRGWPRASTAPPTEVRWPPTGAPPIGVVATGLDVVYPPHQHELWTAVAAAGVLLTEAPLGTRPERWRFPARNRIIAALADVVVVVESHRARWLAPHGRRGRPARPRRDGRPGLGAQPGRGGHQRAAGRGAGAGVLGRRRAGGPRPRHGARRRRPTAGSRPHGADRPVLDAVGWQPATLDQLVVRTGRDLAGSPPRSTGCATPDGWPGAAAGTSGSMPAHVIGPSPTMSRAATSSVR